MQATNTMSQRNDKVKSVVLLIDKYFRLIGSAIVLLMVWMVLFDYISMEKAGAAALLLEAYGFIKRKNQRNESTK